MSLFLDCEDSDVVAATTTTTTKTKTTKTKTNVTTTSSSLQNHNHVLIVLEQINAMIQQETKYICSQNFYCEYVVDNNNNNNNNDNSTNLDNNSTNLDNNSTTTNEVRCCDVNDMKKESDVVEYRYTQGKEAEPTTCTTAATTTTTTQICNLNNKNDDNENRHNELSTELLHSGGNDNNINVSILPKNKDDKDEVLTTSTTTSHHHLHEWMASSSSSSCPSNHSSCSHDSISTTCTTTTSPLDIDESLSSSSSCFCSSHEQSLFHSISSTKDVTDLLQEVHFNTTNHESTSNSIREGWLDHHETIITIQNNNTTTTGTTTTSNNTLLEPKKVEEEKKKKKNEFSINPNHDDDESMIKNQGIEKSFEKDLIVAPTENRQGQQQHEVEKDVDTTSSLLLLHPSMIYWRQQMYDWAYTVLDNHFYNNHQQQQEQQHHQQESQQNEGHRDDIEYHCTQQHRSFILHSTFNLLDRIIYHELNTTNAPPITRDDYQLFCMVSLYIIVKTHCDSSSSCSSSTSTSYSSSCCYQTDPDDHDTSIFTCKPMSIQSLVDMSRHYYSADIIIATEYEIYHTIQWQINVPTPIMYCHLLYHLFIVEKKEIEEEIIIMTTTTTDTTVQEQAQPQPPMIESNFENSILPSQRQDDDTSDVRISNQEQHDVSSGLVLLSSSSSSPLLQVQPSTLSLFLSTITYITELVVYETFFVSYPSSLIGMATFLLAVKKIQTVTTHLSSTIDCTIPLSSTSMENYVTVLERMLGTCHDELDDLSKQQQQQDDDDDDEQFNELQSVMNLLRLPFPCNEKNCNESENDTTNFRVLYQQLEKLYEESILQ